MKNQITVIVAGPTNSGKTAIVAHLLKALTEVGVNVRYDGFDFDNAEDLLAWAEGKPELYRSMAVVGTHTEVAVVERNLPNRSCPNTLEEVAGSIARFEEAGRRLDEHTPEK